MALPGKKIALATATLVFLAWIVSFFGPSSAVTVTKQDKFGGTALHQLAQTFSFKRDFGKLKDLVQAGTVDLYQKDQLNFSFLHRLIYPLNSVSQVTPSQFHEIVAFLLQSGHKRVLEQHGAAVGATILHMAVRRCELERKTLELFFKFSRKSLDTPDIYGRSIYFNAVQGNRSPAFFKDMVEVTGEELRFITGHAGETLLHHAAELGTIEMVEFLIKEGGLDVNQEDDYGETPASFAVRPQSEFLMELVVPKLKLLQEAGADLHHISKLRTNIWTYASIQANVETLDYLLDNGFKVDEQGPEGLYPIQDIMTPQKSQLEFQYKLITKKVELLIKRGVDIHRVSSEATLTYLHYAAMLGPVDLVQLFVKEGLDPNAQTIDGQTPFHLIGQERYKNERESVLKKSRILLDAGADMSLKNIQGTLPREALAKTLKSLGGGYTTLDDIMEEGDELSRKLVDEVKSYNQMKKETIASAASENTTKDEL